MNFLLARIKNTKIIQSIIIMFIVSLLATVSLGVSSFLSLSKQNQTMTSMNEEILPKLKDWEDVNGHMGVLRNTLTKIIDRKFDDANEKTMLDLNNKIQTIITRQMSQIGSMPDEEADLAKLVKQNYEHYYSFIPDIMEQRKKGLTPDPQITNVDMGKYGTELNNNILALVDYEKKTANDKALEAQKLYRKSLMASVAIFLVSIVILSTLSIFVIIMTRGYIKSLIHKLSLVAQGDLTIRFNNGSNTSNEFGIIYNALDQTFGSLSAILRAVQNDSAVIQTNTHSLAAISEVMNKSIGEVSSAIHEVSLGSGSQAEELSQMNDALQALGTRLEHIASSVAAVDQNANSINGKAQESSEQLNELVQSIQGVSTSFGHIEDRIDKLTASVNRITDITNLLNEIANQTNLLSLNASIEAARAGEAGKGFAVVAGEIRKLAEQSRLSSESINELLKEINTEVQAVTVTSKDTNRVLQNQTSVVEASMGSFGDIIASIQRILPQINDMTGAIRDVNANKDSILSSAESTSAVAQQNSASSQQISASSFEISSSSMDIAKAVRELDELSQKMTEAVNRFVLA